MSDISNKIDEALVDLQSKLDSLLKYAEDADSQYIVEIHDVKQKAANVLIQVTNRVKQTSEETKDEDEIQNVLDIVKLRSKELYENAIKKIDKIQSNKDGTENNEDENVVSFNTKSDDVKAENKNDVKFASQDITSAALYTLRSWLKPEEK